MTKSETIAAFLKFLREAEQECNDAIQKEREADLQTQDILHRLELHDDGYHNDARMARALRRIRKERRTARDEHMVTEPIVKWCRDNPGFIKKLNMLAGEIRRTEKQLANRHYNERTDVISRTLSDIDREQPKLPPPGVNG